MEWWVSILYMEHNKFLASKTKLLVYNSKISCHMVFLSLKIAISAEWLRWEILVCNMRNGDLCFTVRVDLEHQ